MALCGLAPQTFGVERFPPPEFESGYKIPPTTAPAPRAEFLEYLDVAVLVGSLALAAYFVHRRRSRPAILGLMIFSILYFGFYRKGCICSIGSIQDVVLAAFNSGYAVPLTAVAFFLAPLLFALVFGRVFCAAVCPHGAAQDLVCVHPVKVPPWLEHALGLLPFVYLGAAVLFAATGSAFLICQYDPFIAFFRRSGSFNMLALGAVFLVVGIFVGRPYCRFLCPYGALLRLTSFFAKWFVTLTPQDCVQCQICDVACPYGAIQEPTESGASSAVASAWRTWMPYVVLVPLLAGLGGWLEGRLAIPFSKLHETVRLAERIAAEEEGKITEVAEKNAIADQASQPGLGFAEANLRLSSKAFRGTGRPVADLIADARQIRGRFVFGARLLGAFLGLVMGLKLLALALPRVRTVYEPDRGACVACGRCYTYCPNDLVRRKQLQKAAALTPAPS